MATQPRFIEPTPIRDPGVSESSAASLLSRLLSDVTGLLRNEVALAKSEFTQAADDAKRGAGGIAAGGAILFAGLLGLLAAAILGLSNIVAPWAAALIVGGAAALVGFAMLKSARAKFSSTAIRMERTQESLRKDTAAVARSKP
jgi:hypothetical protein